MLDDYRFAVSPVTDCNVMRSSAASPSWSEMGVFGEKDLHSVSITKEQRKTETNFFPPMKVEALFGLLRYSVFT